MHITDVYECPQCRKKITLPKEMTAQDQEEIARICREVAHIEAWRVIIERFGLGLVEGKVVMVHISVPKDHCANCRKPLLESGITYCPSCSGLNFNW